MDGLFAKVMFGARLLSSDCYLLEGQTAMATKKKTSTKENTGDIIFTDTTIVITLDSAAKRKAKACLEKNKKITFSVREHNITRLPQIENSNVAVD